jgi:hypothetical protein
MYTLHHIEGLNRQKKIILKMNGHDHFNTNVF